MVSAQPEHTGRGLQSVLVYIKRLARSLRLSRPQRISGGKRASGQERMPLLVATFKMVHLGIGKYFIVI